jgi:serine/threonine-protein kinase
VVSLPGASAGSLARSDPDRTFFRSVARIGMQVAEALEYANRQGVLHRDVKPSNLLLDPKGNVWVADFGLAKAADAEDITHSGDIVGTVRYMAPERFAGRCDARSDVYALGLTLYELLALRPAYGAADRHELMRRVMSEEPQRLRELVAHLPRDLETIVEKAIAREPAERYASAAALAEDLQRYLDDKPIKARRVSAAEQALRWAKRNPAVAALAAGLLLALMAGLAGVTWQWRKAVANLDAAESANRKAQARFDLAMEAVRAFTTGASEDVILKEKALEGLRKKLLGQSQSFYDKLRASLEGETDRASRSALAEALFDAGKLYGDVDDAQRALEAHRSALALRDALLRERPDDPVSRRDLARSHLALAGVLRSEARIDEARQEVVRARGVLEPLVRERPDDGGSLRLWAECDSLEGLLLALAGRLEEARADLQRARATFERLIHDDPPYTLPTAADGPTEYRRGLAEVLAGISKAFAREGRDDEAARVWEAQRVVVEELASGRFADDTDRRRLGLACSQHIERLFRLGRPDEAIRTGELGLRILESLVDTNVTVVTYKIDLAVCLANLSETHRTQGHLPKARRLASRSLSFLRSLTAEQKGATTLVAGEAIDELTLAECDLDARRFVDAREHIGRCLAICEDAARAHPEDLGFPQVLCNALVLQGLIELSAGRAEAVLQAAARLREIAVPILRDRHDDRLLRDWYLSGLLLETMVQVKLGRMSDAANGAEQFAGEVERLKPPLNPVERFFDGAAHALFFVLGRPFAGSGRISQPPGLMAHADRAVAEILEADRLGFRNPTATAMAAQLLPGRTELRDLLMDQRFPADPFVSDPSIEEGESSTRIGGAIP